MEQDFTCLSSAKVTAPPPRYRLADGCTAKSARAGTTYTCRD